MLSDWSKFGNQSYMIKVLIAFDNMLFSSMNKYARFHESQTLFRFATDYNLEKGKL